MVDGMRSHEVMISGKVEQLRKLQLVALGQVPYWALMCGVFHLGIDMQGSVSCIRSTEV
jgi:hypothetical protein